MGVTDLWLNRTFALSVTWIYTFVRSTLPLLLLCILTYCIIVTLRKMMSKTLNTNNKKRRKQSHKSITYTLVLVIIVFVICVTPDAIMSLIGLGYTESDADFLVCAFREFSDFLLSVNSGCNFILYCVFNKGFRQQFFLLFCRKLRKTKSHSPFNKHNNFTSKLSNSCPDRMGPRANIATSTFTFDKTGRALSTPTLL